MKSPITTHVLDTAQGQPVANIHVVWKCGVHRNRGKPWVKAAPILMVGSTISSLNLNRCRQGPIV